MEQGTAFAAGRLRRRQQDAPALDGFGHASGPPGFASGFPRRPTLIDARDKTKSFTSSTWLFQLRPAAQTLFSLEAIRRKEPPPVKSLHRPPPTPDATTCNRCNDSEMCGANHWHNFVYVFATAQWTQCNSFR